MAFLFFAWKCWAQGSEGEKLWLISETNLQIIDVDGREALLLQLDKLKAEVEKDAFITTLKLCEGYRRAVGLGPHPYHKKYMYSFAGAMAEWAYFFGEGVIHTGSQFFGEKSQWIEARKLGLFDLEFWFGSVRLHFLLQSQGFMRASVHCLNSTDRFQLRAFAGALVNANALGIWTTDLSGGAVFGLLLRLVKASKLAVASFSPVVKSVQSFGQSLKGLISNISNKQWVMVGGVLMAPVAYQVYENNERSEQADVFMRELSSDSEEQRAQRERLVKLKRAYDFYQELVGAYLAAAKTKGDCDLCKKISGVFLRYLAKNFTNSDLAQLRMEQRELALKIHSEVAPSEMDVRRLEFYRYMVPVVTRNLMRVAAKCSNK